MAEETVDEESIDEEAIEEEQVIEETVEVEEEFTIAGQNMPDITLWFGIFLMTWGALFSLISNSKSPTSWAPTMAGMPIFVSGYLAKTKPMKRKLWMHIAVTFGLICALGGTRFFMVISEGINYASGSQLMLLVTGTIYTAVCVKSFIWARKQREAASTD